MIDWVRELDWRVLGPALALASIAFLVASAFLLPVVIVRLPPDYFRRPRAPRDGRQRWKVIHVLRNLLAVLLGLAGLAMLVLPGQGVLTLLAAVAISDLPGRDRLVRSIVGRPGVLRALNALRRRAHAAPLEAPDGVAADETPPKPTP